MQKDIFRFSYMRGGVVVARASRNVRKQRVKTSLLKQLESRDMDAELWRDLINDYLTFWEIKDKLTFEIERNGAMITIKNGKQEFRKRNDAVVELPKISKRMTDILDFLNIVPEEAAKEDPDEDDEDY